MNSLIISEFKKIINLYEKVIQYLTETYESNNNDIKNMSKSLEINKLSYKVYRFKKSLEIIKEYPMEVKKIEDLNRIKGITPITSDIINQIIKNGRIIDNGINSEFIVYFGLEKICEDDNIKDEEDKLILEQPSIDTENVKKSSNLNVNLDSQAFFGSCINNPFQNISDIFTNLLNYIY